MRINDHGTPQLTPVSFGDPSRSTGSDGLNSAMASASEVYGNRDFSQEEAGLWLGSGFMAAMRARDFAAVMPIDIGRLAAA